MRNQEKPGSNMGLWIGLGTVFLLLIGGGCDSKSAKGDNKQGDNKQGDNKQGDNKQGDNKQGDNKQGDNKAKDDNKGPMIVPGLTAANFKLIKEDMTKADLEKLFGPALANPTAAEIFQKAGVQGGLGKISLHEIEEHKRHTDLTAWAQPDTFVLVRRMKADSPLAALFPGFVGKIERAYFSQSRGEETTVHVREMGPTKGHVYTTGTLRFK